MRLQLPISRLQVSKLWVIHFFIEISNTIPVRPSYQMKNNTEVNKNGTRYFYHVCVACKTKGL